MQYFGIAKFQSVATFIAIFPSIAKALQNVLQKVFQNLKSIAKIIAKSITNFQSILIFSATNFFKLCHSLLNFIIIVFTLYI